MLLKIRGKFKKDILIGDESTVQDLKLVIQNDSGLDTGVFSLIAGGKSLSDGGKKLKDYGITDSKLIMVIASSSSTEVETVCEKEKTLSHLEKVVETASKLASRSRIVDDENDFTREEKKSHFMFELTDQHGKRVKISSQDQDALMKGMMIHEKGRHILYGNKTKRRPFQQQIRDALAFFHESEQSFRNVDPKLLDLVDNYACVCLDVVWCLFLLQDLRNISVAERLLQATEAGFIKSHGPNLERLVHVKGPHCAERALYVRLHLLQGVLALAKGDMGSASQILLLARQECDSLKVAPELVAELMSRRAALPHRAVTQSAALRALRATGSNLSHAEVFLEDRWQNEEMRRKEEAAQRKQKHAQRKLGKTENGSWVDASLVDALVTAGFEKNLVIRNLKRTNNDQEKTLLLLTTGATQSSWCDESEEGIVTLISLGMSEAQARQLLHSTNGNVEAQARQLLHPIETMDGNSLPIEEMPMDLVQQEGEEEQKAMCAEQTADFENRLPPPPVNEKLESFDKAVAQEIAEGIEDDGEAYLDILLEDESLAIELYLKMCCGTIPVHFNIDNILKKA